MTPYLSILLISVGALIISAIGTAIIVSFINRWSRRNDGEQ